MDKTWDERSAGSAYKRPNFPTEFKRQLVEQSFEPGASVALIARSNDINAKLLFKWRRLYLAGEYGLPTLPEGVAPKPTQQASSRHVRALLSRKFVSRPCACLRKAAS
ncbi:transposase [Paraburkholderia hospita]|uniref:transposase n=1 Tax=Paraburkholderia hospita TaxID=169430 RepID=UPI001FC9D836|nr:transposase [Paraburkholderia hospita]